MSIMPLPRHVVNDAVARAIAEDQGGRGDVTSLACIPAKAEAKFYVNAREAGVVCGFQPALAAIWQCDPEALVSPQMEDGDTVKPGDVLISVTGRARGLLAAERILLNFMGRMSGIASFTRAYVDAVKGTGARIAHTRKTTPGFRAFELQAVQAGGGALHRFGLDDAILIKDNHIAASGSIAEALQRAHAYAGHLRMIEIEVDTLDQLAEALPHKPHAVLLDNMEPDMLREAVAMIDGQCLAEASGGITLETVAAKAETGVDYISSGALTHSASNLDLGLDIL